MHHHPQGPNTADALPEVITRYLTAHRAHDAKMAIAAFSDQATVIDDGNIYEGTEAIEGWLDRSATEFRYTIHLTNAEQTDATRYIATHHLEGDFPGGTVDLRYQFTLRDGLIERLVIEP